MEMNKLDEYEQDDEQFILVVDPIDKEPVEILLSKDGTCSLTTIEHAFPRAYGLKYKNPLTGAKRIVRLDESGKNFIAPTDGWEGKTFEIIFKPAAEITSEHKDANGKKDDDKKTVHIQKAGTKRKFEGDEESNEQLVVVGSGDVKERSGESGDEFECRTGEEKKVKRMQTAADIKLDKSGKECVDLICMGLPYDLEEWALQTHFEQFGEVDFREIKRNKKGDSRGFGFVRMVRYSDQVRALSQSKHIIGGRECNVRISSTEKSMETYLAKLVESSQTPRLFVGGLNEEIYRLRLEEFFTEQIHRFDKNARINDMYYPRPFRGFAFITIDSIKAAKELIRQTDFMLDDYHCMVTIAEPKYQQDDQSASTKQSQQPWVTYTVNQRQPLLPSYSSYEPRPPTVELFSPDQRWNGGGGIARGVSRYDEYAPRGGNGPDGSGHFSNFESYPVGYPPRRTAFDPMEGFESFAARGGRGAIDDVWMGGNVPGGPSSSSGNIPPEQAHAVLRQLPDGAVGTALKMLQSMIGGRMQHENGRDGSPN